MFELIVYFLVFALAMLGGTFIGGLILFHIQHRKEINATIKRLQEQENGRKDL